MRFFAFSPDEISTYNNFVARSQVGSFLQAWEWGEAQREYGQREVFRFGLEFPDTLAATAQVIRIPLFARQYYLYIPYGPVLADPMNGRVLETLLEELRKKFPDAMFIRYEPKFTPLYALPGTKSINIQPGRTLVIDLRKTEGEILAQMHHKTRYNVRLAQRHTVEIQKQFVVTSGHGLLYKEAIDLILETAKRQGYVTHPLSYYEKLINFFSVHNPGSSVAIAIYKALYEKQLLATGLMIDFGTTRTYLFGGSSTENRHVMAPYLLHYQAMLDAKEQGRQWYDFDGLEQSVGKEAGFARFKLGFGGHVLEYAGAYDLVFHRALYNAYRALRRGNRLIKQLRK